MRNPISPKTVVHPSSSAQRSKQSSCVIFLGGLRVRLHGLKVRGKKRAPVMPLVQHADSPRSEEGRSRHVKKTEYGQLESPGRCPSD